MFWFVIVILRSTVVLIYSTTTDDVQESEDVQDPGIEGEEEYETVPQYGYDDAILDAVSYTHLRAHETKANLVCRLLLEKKKI